MKKMFFCSIVFLSIFSCTRSQSGGSIQVRGSDTMVNIVQILAEEYMAKKEGTSLSITGGGSGTGLAALENKTSSIANSSRDINDIERTSLGEDLREITLGMDGFSVIVSNENPIDRLTISDLGKIFRGEITNWKELGGNDVEISLYGRQPNSGTYVFFRDNVLKADYSRNLREMNGNSQILESVARSNRGSGIGYVGSGYTSSRPGDIKVLLIAKEQGGSYYAPTAENVRTGKYPLARPLYQYFLKENTDLVKDFILFQISKEGQKMLTENGFFPISEEQKKRNLKAIGL